MIIDQIALSGLDAYLIDREQDPLNVNLAQSGQIGHSIQPGEGRVFELSSISLLCRSDRLYELMSRQATPLFTIDVSKEMFPGLYSDPYAHRVHNLAGMEWGNPTVKCTQPPPSTLEHSSKAFGKTLQSTTGGFRSQKP